MHKQEVKKQNGFTLIEILVVIGLIAILAAVVIIAINPARQFAQGRNSQRSSNTNAILNAIGQRMADNKGLFRTTTDTVCTSAMDIPASTTVISNTALNLRPCLVPTYLPEMPFDPSNGAAWDSAASTYNTDYTVGKDTNGRITVCAPSAVESAIPGSTQICVTR